MNKMTIGLLHTTIRGDEKLLIESAQKAGVHLELIDVRSQVFRDNNAPAFNVALERCISTTLGMLAIRFYETRQIPVINSYQVASLCEDKFVTSLTLHQAGIATPRFCLAFDEAHAKKAIQDLGGYPVVVKPTLGSWGRLIAKVNDDESLEALIEHKHMLGGPSQKPLYIQQFITKPERDIRVTMVGDQMICAIYRHSDHWITNTARGAEAQVCKVDKDLEQICVAASRAVGGGVLGIDVFETDSGYTINEVNHTVEFKNVQRVTGVDVAGEIINYVSNIDGLSV